MALHVCIHNPLARGLVKTRPKVNHGGTVPEGHSLTLFPVWQLYVVLQRIDARKVFVTKRLQIHLVAPEQSVGLESEAEINISHADFVKKRFERVLSSVGFDGTKQIMQIHRPIRSNLWFEF